MFYCSKFYFDIIHVASADEYYNKFKDTTCSLCYAYFFKCSQKSKRYVGITHTFEIENMHFSHKFSNFTPRTFVYKFLELILYRKNSKNKGSNSSSPFCSF